VAVVAVHIILVVQLLELVVQVLAEMEMQLAVLVLTQ
jgi:hypothetical protein